MDDCLIIGAGVVGLSIAYEMADQGARVTVIDRQQPGREASWAGAGILPAATLRGDDPAYQQLAGLSHQLHPRWAAQLMEETGIDTGFQNCGELYLASGDTSRESTQEEIDQLTDRGISTEEVTLRLGEVEPEVHTNGSERTAAWLVPESSQLRNPRHLKALIAACRRRGARIVAGVGAVQFQTDGNAITSAATEIGSFRASNYCVCAGAWSAELLQQLDCNSPVRPIRGQMVLLNAGRKLFQRVLQCGPHYLVPRDDGRVLVGSTLEDVGFRKHTTPTAIDRLRRFATACVPALGEAVVERSWAGLRPGAREGEAFLGQVPGLENAFAATGHYRWGLYLSPGTATVMSQLMLGETPQINLDEFRLDRNLQTAQY
jgi:glycine oxidase